jgi:hypothetical protein
MNFIQEKVQRLMSQAKLEEGLGSEQVQEIARTVISEELIEFKKGTDELQVYLAISHSLNSLQEGNDSAHEIALDTVTTIVNELVLSGAEGGEGLLQGVILGALEGTSLRKQQAIARAEVQLAKLQQAIKEEKLQLRSHLQHTLGYLTSEILVQLLEKKKVQQPLNQLDCLYLSREDNVN